MVWLSRILRPMLSVLLGVLILCYWLPPYSRLGGEISTSNPHNRSLRKRNFTQSSNAKLLSNEDYKIRGAGEELDSGDTQQKRNVRRTFDTARRKNKNIKIVGRVVGGRDAREGEIPYFVALMDHGHIYCGGTLISPYWVVTAKHCCVSNGKWNRVLPFILGGMIYRYDYHGENVVASKVAFFYWHPASDFALLKLKYRMNPNPYVQPINFYTADDTNTIEKILEKGRVPVTVAGFGITYARGPDGEQLSDGEKFPDNLQVAEIELLSKQECIAQAPGFYMEQNENNIICGVPSNRDTCQGDSGGPVVHQGKLLGVTSQGMGCAYGHPGVYARIDYYNSWMQIAFNDVNGTYADQSTGSRLSGVNSVVMVMADVFLHYMMM